MKNPKNWLLLVMTGVIMFLLLLKACEKPSGNSKPIYTKGETVVKYDTILRPFKVVQISKQYYPKWDTSYIDTTNHQTFEKDYLVREYSDSIPDSNLTIFRHSKVVGVIKEQDISYRLKTPLEVIKTLSRVDTLETIKPSKWNLYTGLETGGNLTQFNISPFITLNARQASMTFRYGILDKSYNIGVGIRILKSRK